ncbi:MAG TPA: phosphatidylglycerol lysyltransferase domain-containing protein [Candidatus Limnocylindrales bacterium]|nr:phosphatidylglycerol lysyltransferase domain-containing protein [Candidatus Limnocylindrales bacterium]
MSASTAKSHDPWQRTVLALAVAAQGVINLVSAILSHPPDRLLALRRLVPTSVMDSSRTFTLVAGALLVTAAWGLRRGKRSAFVAALFLTSLSVPMNLLKAIDFEEATAASVLLFALGLSGDAFRVKSRGLTFGTVGRTAVALGSLFLLYAVAGCWWIEARYGLGASLGSAAAEAAYRLFGVGEPVFRFAAHPTPIVARVVHWFLHSLAPIGTLFLVGIAFALMRPVGHRGRHRSERERVARLLRHYGDSSVGAFALEPDVDYFFSPTGRAVIAYRFESNVLLVLGDPIGPEEEFASLLAQFHTFCAEHDWSFAFFQARPDRLPLYREAGWRAVHIGVEPILHVDRFTLEGSAMGDVRRAKNKLEAAGFQVRHFPPDADPFDPTRQPALRDQIAAVSAEWLRSRKGAEKGFAMGRFDMHRVGQSWLALAVDPARGRVEAFLTWVPIPVRRGWALDLMRRRDDAPAGIIEFLIASCVETARARGDATLSLSLSALAKTEPDAAGAGDRARAFLMDHLRRFYDFEGLFRWKSKFAPEFEPRFLVYDDPLALPRVVLALARAQSPGGFLSYFRKAA